MDRQKQWSIDSLIECFATHLRDVCGAAESTWELYGSFVRDFLSDKYGGSVVDLSCLRAPDLIRYVTERSTRYKPWTVKVVVTALRSFLRFLQSRNLCDGSLAKALPTIPFWRLSGLPRSLSEEQWNNLLGSFDTTTGIGCRDRGIVCCLGFLGLRAGEVAGLSLDDIDWRAGTISIAPGKARRAGILPLPMDVGKALVAYLRRGRPLTQTRSIFVRHMRPVGIPMTSDSIRAVVRRAFERTGLDTPSKGTHQLRHTVASRMLQHGATLKEIADVLRHRSIETTRIYAKVNLPMLFEVVMAWPEVR